MLNALKQSVWMIDILYFYGFFLPRWRVDLYSGATYVPTNSQACLLTSVGNSGLSPQREGRAQVMWVNATSAPPYLQLAT